MSSGISSSSNPPLKWALPPELQGHIASFLPLSLFNTIPPDSPVEELGGLLTKLAPTNEHPEQNIDIIAHNIHGVFEQLITKCRQCEKNNPDELHHIYRWADRLGNPITRMNFLTIYSLLKYGVISEEQDANDAFLIFNSSALDPIDLESVGDPNATNNLLTRDRFCLSEQDIRRMRHVTRPIEKTFSKHPPIEPDYDKTLWTIDPEKYRESIKRFLIDKLAPMGHSSYFTNPLDLEISYTAPPSTSLNDASLPARIESVHVILERAHELGLSKLVTEILNILDVLLKEQPGPEADSWTGMLLAASVRYRHTDLMYKILETLKDHPTGIDGASSIRAAVESNNIEALNILWPNPQNPKIWFNWSDPSANDPRDVFLYIIWTAIKQGNQEMIEELKKRAPEGFLSLTDNGDSSLLGGLVCLLLGHLQEEECGLINDWEQAIPPFSWPKAPQAPLEPLQVEERLKMLLENLAGIPNNTKARLLSLASNAIKGDALEQALGDIFSN